MIITQSPLRISFFGGGTDIPEYFNEYGGSIISTSIDKCCYTHLRHLPRVFDYNDSVTYAITEKVKKIDDIKHPMVRNAIKYLDMHEVSIGYDADLPARSGLGSSSAFAVGLLLAFHCLKGEYVDKRQLSKEAIHVERVLCREAGGWQDQIASAFGGLNRIDFKDNDFHLRPIIMNPERKKLLESNLMIFFTGISRMSAEIQNDTKANIRNNIDNLKGISKLVDDAEILLTDKCSELDDFGRMLNEEWMRKKQLGSRISNDLIDQAYEEALKGGAIGGKLLGAGGGGFLLFYVPEERKKCVRERLKGNNINFCFEENGAEVLYYRSEGFEPLEVYND